MRNCYLIAQEFKLDVTDPRVWGIESSIKMRMDDDFLLFLNTIRIYFIDRQNEAMDKATGKSSTEIQDGIINLTPKMKKEMEEAMEEKK